MNDLLLSMYACVCKRERPLLLTGMLDQMKVSRL